MVHGTLHPDGSLTDMGYRPASSPDDVPLSEMPSGFGPFTYDSTRRLAVRDTRAIEAERARELAVRLRDAQRDLTETERLVSQEPAGKARDALTAEAARLRTVVSEARSALNRT